MCANFITERVVSDLNELLQSGHRLVSTVRRRERGHVSMFFMRSHIRMSQVHFRPDKAECRFAGFTSQVFLAFSHCIRGSMI